MRGRERGEKDVRRKSIPLDSSSSMVLTMWQTDWQMRRVSATSPSFFLCDVLVSDVSGG